MISVCSARTIQASPSSIQLFFPRNRRRITSDVLRFSTNLSTRCSDDDEYGEAQSERIANYAGIRLEETVDVNPGKVRLDSWISCRINGISRARVQSSIRAGLVSVNGRIIDKVATFFRREKLHLMTLFYFYLFSFFQFYCYGYQMVCNLDGELLLALTPLFFVLYLSS